MLKGTATKVHQVVTGFIQVSMKSLPEWRLKNLSWQLLPLVPNDEKGFLYLKSGFLLFPFWSFVSHSPDMGH